MKKVCAIILLVAGVLSVALGITSFTLEVGEYERDYAYGGDAYTGIQNAAAGAANNARIAARIERFGFGSVLLVAGLALIGAGFGSFETKKSKAAFPAGMRQEKTPPYQPPVPPYQPSVQEDLPPVPPYQPPMPPYQPPVQPQGNNYPQQPDAPQGF